MDGSKILRLFAFLILSQVFSFATSAAPRIPLPFGRQPCTTAVSELARGGKKPPRIISAEEDLPGFHAAEERLRGDLRRGAPTRGFPVLTRETEPPAEPVLRTSNPIALQFSRVADAIETRRERIKRILLRINTIAGADYEIFQALSTLRNAAHLELYNLENTNPLKNVAVYGSTNIPLYTLILHAVIPSTISENIWFRTPLATREVYAALFEELRSALPPGSLDRIHILTDPKDVQYDNFRKQYVLGLNRKGKTFSSRPAEMVIFTGNPTTARKILTEIREKIQSLGDVEFPFKQVFLGFGAGLNPVIITRDASQRLSEAVDATLEPIRINCSQDCIAPSFYAVDRDIAPAYLGEVLAKVHHMRPGQREDSEAGYSELTLSEDVSRLLAYREKYAKYLQNPEASIDPVRKLVSPHIFVFPIEMFKEVQLQEHYAPFVTIFTYGGLADLKTIAKDMRVQNRAMYASIFGGTVASEELNQTVALFQQERHGVTVNASVYADESGNMSFGGMGADASLIATTTYEPGKPVAQTLGHHPVLFSEEASFAFGKPTPASKPLIQPQTHYQRTLQAVLALARQNISHLPALPYNWSRLKEPQTTTRSTGLAAIRSVIQKHGLFQFLNRPRPAMPAEVSALEYFYGTPIIFTSDLPPGQRPVHRDGALLHTSSVEEGPQKLNQVRGSINPHLGFGHLMGLLDGNKSREFELSEAVQPGIMARTEKFRDLFAAGKFHPSLSSLRSQLRGRLTQILSGGQSLSTEERKILHLELKHLVEVFFEAVRREFPEGAFIKNFDDYATADLGIQITSFGSNAGRIADQFLMRFEANREEYPANDFSDSLVQRGLMSEPYETGTKFLNTLLKDPDELLVQSRVSIDRTPMDFKKEYRVSFLDGEPVMARLRFSHEYLPDDGEVAMELVRKFFAKAPAELRHLSGGADIAFHQGKPFVIEWNFGAADGTTSPRIFPIEANEFISNLQGKPSPLIQDLEKAFQAGPEAQRTYLKSLKQERELWQKQTINDLSVFEVAKWLRNRHLKEWEKNPTKASGKEVIATLQTLFSGLTSPENRDLENLIRGAEHFVEAKRR